MTNLEFFISKLNGYNHGDGYSPDNGSNGYSLSSGCGFFDCFGSGYGENGDSSGLGYGESDGKGFDYGSGDGYGSGYGEGDDESSGYGYCSIYGYDSSSSGVLAFNGQKVLLIDGLQTVIYSVHGNFARCLLLNKDLTTTPAYLARYKNYVAHGKTLHEAVEDAKNKFIKAHSEEERIDMFITAFPDIRQEVDGEALFEWHGLLTLSCKAGREEWCHQNKIVPASTKMTVKQFLEMTKNGYGGEIIEKVIDLYKKR